MLRITLERREGDTARLSLEGTIAGPWVEELRRACKAAGVAGTPVVLGMAGVSFVDSEGARLGKLCRRSRRGRVDMDQHGRARGRDRVRGRGRRVVDEGDRLVRTLAEAGASVRDCSPFVRELLEGACDDPDEN